MISHVIILNKVQALVWLDLGFIATILATLDLVISYFALGGSLRNLTQ